MTSFWHGRRVLVTGATGFVGSALVRELLERRADVVALVRDMDPRSELVRSGDIQRTHVVHGSLETPSVVERAINAHEVDTVFHLGAQALVQAARRAPLDTFESNIRGTYHLLEACRIHDTLVKRVVVASSDKAYGDHGGEAYTEEMPLQGRNPYDVSKTCTDLLAQAYAASYGAPLAIVRAGNIYGPGDLNMSRIVPGTIMSLLAGQPPTLRSDGTPVREYLYVGDVVDAYLGLAERMGDPRVPGEAFNLGTGHGVSVLDIVSLLQKILQRSHLEPTLGPPAKGEIPQQRLVARKVREVIGWTPRHSLEEGMRATAEWYRAHHARMTGSQ